MSTATTPRLEPMPKETLVFDGLWELTWAGSYWTISIRRKGGKIGYEVSRNQKRIGYVATVALARTHIRSIVENENS